VTVCGGCTTGSDVLKCIQHGFIILYISHLMQLITDFTNRGER